MSKKFTLLSVCLILTYCLFGQNQQQKDKIDEVADIYVSQHINKTEKLIVPDYIFEEYTDTEQIERIKLEYKRTQLRNDFFEINPTLAKFYKKRGIGILNEILVSPCEDGNFESGVNNFRANYHTRASDPFADPSSVSSTTINTDGSNTLSNHLSLITLVNPSRDPILSQNTLFQLDRVKEGSKAIRINNNEGYHNPNGPDDDFHRAVNLIKKFNLKSEIITFDYAQVFEFGQSSHGSVFDTSNPSYKRHPYFKVEVYVVGNTTPIHSEVLRPDTGSNQEGQFQRPEDANASNGSNIVYRFDRDWKQYRIELNENYIGENVELRLQVADCLGGRHGGYVYIDNIKNDCDVIVVDCDNASTYFEFPSDIWATPSYGAYAAQYPTTINARVTLTNPFPNPATVSYAWNPDYINGFQETGGYLNNFAGNARAKKASQFKINKRCTSQYSPNGFTVPMKVVYTDKVTGDVCEKYLNPLVQPCDAGGPGDALLENTNSTVKADFTITPNPSSGDFKVTQLDAIKKVESVSVSDIYGAEVKRVSGKNNQGLIRLNSRRNPGVYFVTVTYTDGTYSTKQLIIK